MATTVAFVVFSLVAVIAAWRVVVTKDVVRAALALVVVLGAMAPLFLLLSAEFTAVVQVLVYVGAVVVLLLFGIMLTRSPSGEEPKRSSPVRPLPAALLSGSLFVVLAIAIVRSDFPKVGTERIWTTEAVGQSLLRNYVVPFEVLSVLLLVTLIGAIALARRD